MPTIAWFNAELAGIAGDMALGALLDAGADLDEVRAVLARLRLEGWSLDRHRVQRAGLVATRAVVGVPDTADHRRWRDVRRLLDAADLPPRVHRRAHAVFAALAGVEAELHGTLPDDVHFHEVGALDALVDVVGTCAALESLGIDDLRCSPVAQGRGTTASAHGALPVPAPAVVRLLAAVEAPVVGVPVDAELTTPTGAALMTALAEFGPLPAMRVTAGGFGAGRRRLEGRPNTTQVVVGEAETAVVVETNVDDVTGEVLAHTVARLLAAGAQDAWVTPIVMKKGRPAHTVAFLADPVAALGLTDLLLAETGSLGARTTPVAKRRRGWTLEEHHVEGRPVRVKVAAGRVKVEHDDAAAAAAELGLPLRDVLSRVEPRA